MSLNDHRFCIAPMMKKTDRHFRFLARQFTKKSMLYTEMIHSNAILKGDKDKLLSFSDIEHPVGLQLGGSDPETLAQAANIGQSFGYDEINLNVGCPSKKVKSGPLGGDQAIGHMISTGNIRGIIFFRDPLSAHPHHADIEALGRLCDVYQIPLATNPATGIAVLEYLSENRDKENQETNPILDQYNAQQDQITDQ